MIQAFAELTAGCRPEYFPTLASDRDGATELADAYDEEMERRGDSRRAFRSVPQSARHPDRSAVSLPGALGRVPKGSFLILVWKDPMQSGTAKARTPALHGVLPQFSKKHTR
jgi:hypothetical protein